MTRMPKIILASTSPRRKQLLGLLKIKFKTADSGYKENMGLKLSPEKLVKYLAFGKAQAAVKQHPNAIIIAADTVVVFKGKALGKPKNSKEAFSMLKSFKGKYQTVITGVAVKNSQSNETILASIKSKIKLKNYSNEQIKEYIRLEKSCDKAGGYSPQGAGFNFISKIEGSFTNTLGMPMEFVYNALQKMGVKI